MVRKRNFKGFIQKNKHIILKIPESLLRNTVIKKLFSDPFKKNRSKVTHQEENGMDECVGSSNNNGCPSENDRNAANQLQVGKFYPSFTQFICWSFFGVFRAHT